MYPDQLVVKPHRQRIGLVDVVVDLVLRVIQKIAQLDRHLLPGNADVLAVARWRCRIYNVDTNEESEPMETVIRKWGNSPALRLPTAILKEAGYQLEQKVDLVVSRGRIIIQPSKKVEYDLDDLVNGIHAGNTHDEVNFGRPVGNEAL